MLRIYPRGFVSLCCGALTGCLMQQYSSLQGNDTSHPFRVPPLQIQSFSQKEPQSRRRPSKAMTKVSLDVLMEELPVSFFHYRLLLMCGLAFMAVDKRIAILSVSILTFVFSGRDGSVSSFLSVDKRRGGVESYQRTNGQYYGRGIHRRAHWRTLLVIYALFTRVYDLSVIFVCVLGALWPIISDGGSPSFSPAS